MPHKRDPRPVWKAIIRSGGLMPVSPVERDRFLRVQATMRAVYGLPENTPDDQLIDAQQADRRSPHQIAGLYLAEYARRLDPDDPDLDDIDRAALPWRDHSPGPEPGTYEQPELVPGRWGALLAGRDPKGTRR
jgi:hypothetical protein